MNGWMGEWVNGWMGGSRERASATGDGRMWSLCAPDLMCRDYFCCCAAHRWYHHCPAAENVMIKSGAIAVISVNTCWLDWNFFSHWSIDFRVRAECCDRGCVKLLFFAGGQRCFIVASGRPISFIRDVEVVKCGNTLLRINVWNAGFTARNSSPSSSPTSDCVDWWWRTSSSAPSPFLTWRCVFN